MHNFTLPQSRNSFAKIVLFTCVLFFYGFSIQAQIGVQSPSIRTGVTFQWDNEQDTNNDGDIDDTENNRAASIKSITIDGNLYNNFAVPSGYQLTRLGPGGHGPNQVVNNGSYSTFNSSSATQNINDSNTWDDAAKAAFQSKNLNRYFTSNPNGRNICLDFDKANGMNGQSETDAQLQTLFYDPPLPANAGGVLAVTERGGNNCLYVRFFGFLPGSTTETPLGDTFVRTNGDLRGGNFSPPSNNNTPGNTDDDSDYWGSGREQDNGQTIAIGLFQLDNVAPVGSKITRIRFIAASTDHGDGKVFVLQRYAQPQTETGCVNETIDGQIDNSTTVPAGSTYTVMSGPNPAGTSFNLNTDGSYQYVPQPGFVGDVTFTYKVRLPAPNQNITDTNTVTITIEPNPDDASVQFTCGSTPNNGVLSITGPLGSQYRYALDGGNFQSSTQFNNIGVGTYVVKVKNINTDCISEVSYTVDDADNAAPVAFGEDFSTGLNQSITFNVLDDNGDGLDFDPDGDPFSIISNTQPSDGSFVNNGNGSFTFTPNNGFVGSTFFTYTIEDDPSPCTNLKKTDTATVTIHVVSDPDPRDCNCSPLYKDSNFVNPQLISGQDLKVGAVYRFANVFPTNPHGTTLDALVKIEEFAGGASLLEIDVTSSGLPEAFQPRINSTNSNDQSVLFSMTFVESGGNYGDEVEISFYGTPLDIDGDNQNTREYAELSLPDAYFVSNNTLLDITQTATNIRGESSVVTVAPGDDVSLDPRFTFSNYWQTKSSLNYRIGKLDGNSDRYYSFNVSCADFEDPDAIFITNPVICGNVSDEQGNPLANVTLDITGSDGSSETVTTDSNGDYKKEVVIPNPLTEVVFEIFENDLPGYISVSDVDGANDNLITRTISLESSCGNDFVDGFEVILELVTKTDILCNGDNTGSITVTTSGGVPPYTYTLNGGAPQGSPTFNNLVAGNYNIVVTDSLGNTDSLLVNLIQPEPLNIELTKTNASATALCQNGTATATVTGGVGPYTYQWDDPNNQTTATATGLSGSLLGGTQYTVVVTDDNGCQEQQSVIITCVQNCDAVINVTDVTNVLCKGENTGSASVSASSSANPGATFTFTWNTTPEQVDAGVTTSTISDQFAGVYTVSVTIDGTLCLPVEESVTITEPSTAVAVTATATDETGPTTNDGTATANPSGGIPPYTYLWSPGGETTQTITGLSDGVYTVTVTDANGCSATTTVTVNDGDCNNLSANASSTPVSCNGGSDGTATVNVTGGLGNFTYSWSPGGQNTQTISGLTAGVYTVTVTDADTQCTATSSTTVNEPTALTSGIAVTNAACFGENTGSLDLTVSGGTSPYSFLWSNGATTEDISNLAAGTYSVVITDANGCVKNDEATVGQPSEALDITISSQDDIVCEGTGSVTVQATGGTAPYSYTLDGGAPQASGTFDNLDAGTYTVSVIDANLCNDSVSVTILENCTIAVNDFRNTVVNVPIDGNVLTNDEDEEGDTQTVTTLSVTTNQGVVVNISSTGEFTYTPPVGYVGNDFFDYSIEDDGNPQATDSARVFIAINPIGQNRTIANADAVFTEVDVPIGGNVLTNDVDIEGDEQTVTTAGTFTLANGTLVLNADGSFIYTPNPGFVGIDTFEYSIVDDNVNPATDSAVLTIRVLGNPTMNYTFAIDDGYGGNQGATITGNVLDNDFDPEGDDQTVDVAVTPVSGPTNGTLTINPDGTFSYTPNDPTFFGNDSFVYEIFDNGTPEARDQATVSILILGQNTTHAINDFRDTVVNIPITGNVLTNDEDLEGDAQVVTTLTVTTDQGVTVNIAPDGTFTYTPPIDYVGGDFFDYSIEDDGNPQATDTARVFIRINPLEQNNTIANADAVFTEVDVAVSGNVLTNDVDIEGDEQTVTTTGTFTLANGTLVLNADGSFVYTPNPGFVGTDTFEYSIVDDNVNPATDAAVLTITVIGNPDVNNTFAVDDGYGGNQGATITGNVLDNDFDPEGDDQTVDVAVTPVSGPTNGTLTINPDGTFSYTPNDPNFFGNDSFVYEIFDNGTPEARDQATVSIIVVGVNTTLAVNDFRDTVVNIPITGNVLTNDEDLEGDAQVVTTLTVTSDQGVTVNIAPDGTFTYTPPVDYVGGDFFDYSIEDDGNPQATDTARVFIRINPLEQNNTIANADAVFTEVDVAVSGNVLTNDVDIEGDEQTVTTTGTFTLANGTLVLNADGSFVYTPNPGFVGTDTFEYSIVDDNVNPATDAAVLTITVIGNPDVNNTFAVDDGYGGNQGATITGNVLDNDFDPEGDDQTVDVAVTPVSGPTNGTLTINPDGTFSYTPNDPTFFGNDSFVYEIFDNGTPEARDQATVSIIIVGENTVLAIDDINNTYVGLPVSGSVATNDENFDGPVGGETFTLVSGPTAGGTLTFNPDGTYDYTPPTDPSISEDTFVYQICDAGNPVACDTATVYIEILPVPNTGNEPPVANADTNTTEVDTPVTGQVLPNDFDPDGDPISVTANTDPINGTVTIDANGTYTYTPGPGFIGVDTFEYTICDNQTPALCDTTTVTIQVIADEGNITVANDDAYNGLIDTVLSGNVLDNDTDPEGDDQTVDVALTPISGPANGVLVINPDGTFTYTPTAGFTGTDQFVYEIFDNGTPIVARDQATVYLTVGNGVNEILAIDDINDTFVNLPVDGNVATNDLNEDGPAGTEVFTLVNGPTNGTLVFNPDGTYSYTPGTDFIGEDTFEYQVCDGGNPVACDTAIVYIEVQPLGSPDNDPPVANADTNSTQIDTPVDGTVLPNDFDPDGDPIVVTGNTDPANGAVTVNPDGTYTYTPDPGFTGEDTFEYTICDNQTPALCDTATVTIQVLDSPDNITTAVDDAYYGFPDTDITGNVLDNDTDPEGNDQTVDVAVSPSNGPSNGTVVLNADGTFTYTPGAGFEGTDSFVYEIFDNGTPVATDAATVYISIASGGNEILAIDDINDTFVNLPVDGSVATNDLNEDGPAGTEVFTLVNGPTNGTLVFNPDGTYTYTPGTDFIGEDTFEYQVCDGGNPVACDTAIVYIEVQPLGSPDNDPPVANADTNSTQIDTPVDGTVLPNDFDPDGDPIVVTGNTDPANGAVTVNPDGTYTYTPDPGFTGEDTFEYTICDNQTPALCDTATVTIQVLDSPDNITTAVDDAYYGFPDTDITGNVLDNDTDPEGNDQTVDVAVSPSNGPSNGTVVLNADGTFTYTPGAGFEGTDSFVYEIFDNGTPVATDAATVYISIASGGNEILAIDDINDTFVNLPVDGNVATNDLNEDGPAGTEVFTIVNGPTNGTLVFNPDGTYTYTPGTDFIGEDTFEYQVCDGGNPVACDTAIVYIEVQPLGSPDNDPPVANADTNSTQIDTPVDGTVLPNDFDPDGDPIVVTGNTDPANGAVTVNPDGTYTYTPDPGFTGEDTFEYTICDNQTPALCDTATVTIQVLDSPDNITTAVDDAYYGFPDTDITGNVLDNDTDPEGNDQTVDVAVSPSNGPSNGTVVLNADGTFTYTPGAGFEGTDSFVYEIFDNGTPVATDAATVYISIADPGNEILAVDDINDTFVNLPVSGSVATNDENYDGPAGTEVFMLVSGPTAGGTLTFNPDGTYDYIPATDYVGDDTFVYQVCDGGNPVACDTANVTITVVDDPVIGNDPPVAINDVNITEVGVPVEGNALVNDFDPDAGDTISVTANTDPTNGTVTIAPNGDYTYTPGPGFEGVDTFEYTICDSATPSLCDTAIVTIYVIGDPGNITVANDDAYYGEIDTIVAGNVLDNDNDPELDNQTLNVATTPVSGPSNGSVLINPDGSFEYTPGAGFTGNDQFVYEIFDDGTPVATDQATVYILIEQTPAPAIAIVKSGVFVDGNGDQCADAGEVIRYTFEVTNEGNVALGTILVTDPLLEAPNPVVAITFVGGDTNGNNLLDVDETWEYTADYAMTQDDIDLGTITNQATAEGTDEDGTTVEDLSDESLTTEDDPTVTEICQSPAIAIVKEASYDDGGDCSQPGEVIEYTFTVTNQGNVSLSNVLVTDVLLGGNVPGPDSGDTDNDGELDVTEAWIYTGSYTITQDDIDAGEVNNQATAEGTAPDGTLVDDLSGSTIGVDETTTTTLCQSPAIAIVKEASYDDGGDCSQPGEVIEYTFTVTNQGNVSLSNVTVNDPLLGGNVPGPDSGDTDGDNELDVTETWIYTGSYTITQGDIDAGEVNNQATAEGTAPDGTLVDDLSGSTIGVDETTTTTLCQSPAIAIVKEASYDDGGDCSQPGEVIEYTFTVTNQGNVSLSNVLVTDVLLGGNVPGPDSGDTDNDGELDVTEAWIYTGSYTITQDDIDAGEVNNQATAEGTAPDGTLVDDLSGSTIGVDEITTTTLCQGPAIAIVKESSYDDGGDCSQPGEVIDYTFTVTNEGNVSLSNIVVTDPLLGGVVAGPDSGDTDNDGELDVTEAWIYTGSYAITQGDIDTGSVTNSATADGTAPDQTVVSDTSGATITDDIPTVTTLCQSPSIALIKRGTLNDENGNGCTDVGETISYAFEVMNTGNVTLSAVDITDLLVNVVGGPITLAPGQVDMLTFTAVYSITQVDIDNGSFENQAIAMGTAPDGIVVQDDSDFDNFIDDNPTITPLCQDASIALIKMGTVMDENGSGCADPKETIDYTFTVMNTGNVTLTNIDIQDPLVNVQGGPITLAPGQTDLNSFTATYLITQANINDGFVENQAVVSGLDPNGATVNDDSDFDSFVDDRPTITPLCQGAAIALIKTANPQDQNGNGCVELGESIIYEFVVKNTGNVVLTNITVTDPLVAVTGGPITLDPSDSDSNTFRAEYFITQEDVDNGFVINQATAEGTAPDGTTVIDASDDDSFDEDEPTEIGLCQDPMVSLEKEGIFNDDNGDGIPQPDETISYVFTVRNTGDVTLYNLTLEDTDLVGIVITGDPIPVLLPGEFDDTSYSATYAITQDDIDNGEVINQAIIRGTTLDGTEVEDTSDDPNELANVDPDGDGDPDDPTVVILPNVLPADDFEIFNGITPDNDGLNDFFRVFGIENFPNNNMKIYNRWGVLVWETDGYGGASGEENVFEGSSNGRATIQADKILPTGTYFYILVRQDPNSGETLKDNGYLYINR